MLSYLQYQKFTHKLVTIMTYILYDSFQNIKVRGLFLMNPHNPLSDVYTQDQLIDMLQFCKRYELKV